jgi:exodeoxyribonuclease-3
MRLDQLILLLRNEKPNVVLLQEIKCEEHTFPFAELEEEGYNIAIFGQKSYNGVAILSKEPLEEVKKGFSHFETHESRYIECITYFKGTALKVASVYIPNGNPNGEEAKQNVKAIHSKRFEYKLDFIKAFRETLREELKNNEHFIVGGDINVAPADIDVYSVKNWEGKVCFLPEEKAEFRAILNLGYSDAIRSLAPNTQMFSWYDYRTKGFDTGKGLRIDHLLTSPKSTDALHGFKVLDYYRGLPKASDHVPMQIELKL